MDLLDKKIIFLLQNSSKRSLYLGEPAFAFSLIKRDIFVKKVKNRKVSAYIKFIKNMAILLGADEDTAEKDMVEVYKFERRMANFTLTR